MARSSYIYVVFHPGLSTGGILIAAFTVKRELVAWWKQYDGPNQAEFEVWRIRDRDQVKSIVLRAELK